MNLALATLIAPLVAAHFSRRMQEETLWLVAAAITAVLGVAFAGFFLSHRRPFKLAWYAAPPLIAFGGFVGGFYAARAIQGPVAIALLAWLAGFALACALLHQYEVRRPHAMKVGVAFMLLTLAIFARYLWMMKFAPGACLKTFVAVDAILTLVWGIHVTLMVAGLVIGWIASRRSCPKRKEEARNASWTARATLALSTSLFANLTLAGWMAVTKALGSLVKDDNISVITFGRELKFQEVIDGILLPNVRLGFTLVALTTAFLIVALIWSIFPSVEDEVKPPDVTASTEPKRSTRLGVWLTTGLVALPRAVDVFSFAWVVLFLVGVGHVVWTTMNGHSGSFIEHLVFATQYPNFAPSTVLMSLSGALLLTMIGAQIWLPAAGGALDVGLDVDNYLREHPVDDTPRARIAERFISLFRHLRVEGYDAIVFVAHSQGTVITADLLRFLRIDGAEPPFAPKTVLFTMGCPLRQLYWRAFPPLYDWMSNEHTMPAETGGVEWVNSYRSGDYVGRWVWNRHDALEWQPGADWHPAPNITDGCIGAGAHLHYWDGTADRIGAQLQAILARL
jgi:hypothetical protein